MIAYPRIIENILHIPRHGLNKWAKMTTGKKLFAGLNHRGIVALISQAAPAHKGHIPLAGNVVTMACIRDKGG